MLRTQKIILLSSVFGFSRMMIGAVSVIFLQSKGLNLQDIASLKALQFFIVFTFSIGISYLADKFGQFFCIPLGSIFGSLWLLITALTTGKFWLFFAEAMNALSLLFMNEPVMALIINSYKEETNDKECSKILGKAAEYNFIFMTLGVLVGMFSPSTNSPTLWLIGAGLMFLLSLSSTILVIQETKHKRNLTSRKYKGVLNIFEAFKSDLTIIKRTIFNDKKIFFGLLFNGLMVSVILQTFIQYWQPIAIFLFKTSSPIFYSIIFGLILYVQSMAGKLFKKKHILFCDKLLILYLCTIVIFLFEYMAIKKHVSILGLTTIVSIFLFLRWIQLALSSKRNSLYPSQYRTTFLALETTVAKFFCCIYFLVFGKYFKFFGVCFIPMVGLIFLSISLFSHLLITKKFEKEINL